MTTEEYENDSLPIASREVETKHMTEQTTASPIMNILPNGSGGGCDGGHGYGGMEALAGILPIALLAPLLTGRGFGRDGGEGGGSRIELAELAAIRHDIGESTVANLKESFQAAKDGIVAGFDAKIAGIEAKFETKVEGEKVLNALENKINHCCEETQKSFCELEGKMEKDFCALKSEMFAGFAAQKERETLEALREAREANAVLTTTINQRALLTDILTSIGLVSPIVPLAKKA